MGQAKFQDGSIKGRRLADRPRVSTGLSQHKRIFNDSRRRIDRRQGVTGSRQNLAVAALGDRAVKIHAHGNGLSLRRERQGCEAGEQDLPEPCFEKLDHAVKSSNRSCRNAKHPHSHVVDPMSELVSTPWALLPIVSADASWHVGALRDTSGRFIVAHRLADCIRIVPSPRIPI